MERSELCTGQKIWLCRGDDQGSGDEFEIESKMDQGGSVLCYRASKSGCRGMLKEFYPAAAAGCLHREGVYLRAGGENGTSGYEDYRKALGLYEQAARKVLDLAAQNPEISTFMPQFELYRGLNERSEPELGSLYLWFPFHPCETFQDICARLEQDTETAGAWKLVIILKCLRELARCVQLLHSKGIILEDITPWNFGYYSRGGERVLEQNVSLFDWNGLWDLKQTNLHAAPQLRFLTKGFSEPCKTKRPVIQSDVYSIGATLFYALCPSFQGYQDELYSKLGSVLEERSPLLQGIRPRGKAYEDLVRQLTDTLKSCLAFRREDRDDSCEMVAGRLTRSIDLCQPLLRRCMNKEAAIQYDLYTRPLGRSIGPGEDKLRILVVGLDKRAVCFLNTALPLCQELEQRLEVIILCSAKQKKDYLKARPALGDFFDLEGTACPVPEDSYGSIQFEILPDTVSVRQVDACRSRIVQLLGQEDSTPIRNVFISLKNDARNRSIAAWCLQIMGRRTGGIPPVIRYVSEDPESLAVQPQPGMVPIRTRIHAVEPQIEENILRMAYNAHCIWSGSLRAGGSRGKEVSFGRAYYKDSSASHAVAIKWKLLALGLDLERMKLEEVARRFEEIIASPEVLDRVMWHEHRRWVTEKLCAGWSSLGPEDCPSGTDKISKSKKHGCIQHSRPDHRLRELVEELGADAVWEESRGLEQLDDLDRFSVLLHQAEKKAAASAGCTQKYRDELHALLSGNRQAWNTFCQWEACVDELVRFHKGDLQREKQLYARLEKESKQLLSQREILESLTRWKSCLVPLLAYLRRQDYKDLDRGLIENIPFILLYDSRMVMAVPYTGGGPSAIIENAAPVLSAWPGSLLYLHYLETEVQLEELTDSLSQLSALLSRRGYAGKGEMLLFCQSGLEKALREKLPGLRAGTADLWPVEFRMILVTDKADIAPQAQEYLTRWQDKKLCSISLEQNDTGLSYLLEAAGLLKKWEGFRFDWKQRRFSGCKALEVLPFTASITVDDVIALRGAHCSHRERPPFFSQYETLWRLSNRFFDGWRTLCNCAAGMSERVLRDPRGSVILAELDRTDVEADKIECLVSIRGDHESRAIQLIGILGSWGLLEQRQSPVKVQRGSRNFLDFPLRVSKGCCEKVKALFEASSPVWTAFDLEPWMGPETFRLLEPERRIWVPRNALPSVQDLLNELAGIRTTDGKAILWREPERDRGQEVCYCFVTPAFRDLFSTEGKILEVYVYHKLLASNAFDDVTSSYEIVWDRGYSGLFINNEFDVLLTKGFQFIAVECKCTSELRPDYYFKLKALAEYFGGESHTLCTLVHSARRKYFKGNECADRERGRRLNVHLISSIADSEAIRRIDERILGLLA